eukprot:7524262-Lingulodinium_polyedra.AAC.1
MPPRRPTSAGCAAAGSGGLFEAVPLATDVVSGLRSHGYHSHIVCGRAPRVCARKERGNRGVGQRFLRSPR